MKLPNTEITYTQADFVNTDDYWVCGKCFALHDHGFILAIIFADEKIEAIDRAKEMSLLERYLVDEDEHNPNEDEDGYDLESMEVIELPKPDVNFTW